MIPADVLAEAGLDGPGHGAAEAARVLVAVARRLGAVACTWRAHDATRAADHDVAIRWVPPGHPAPETLPRVVWQVSVDGLGRVVVRDPGLRAAVERVRTAERRAA